MIADDVKAYFEDKSLVRALIDFQTEIGIKKYGQMLDDNLKSSKEKAVHIVQELVDAMQYLQWLKPDTASFNRFYIENRLSQYSTDINYFVRRYNLTVEDLCYKEGHS